MLLKLRDETKKKKEDRMAITERKRKELKMQEAELRKKKDDHHHHNYFEIKKVELGEEIFRREKEEILQEEIERLSRVIELFESIAYEESEEEGHIMKFIEGSLKMISMQQEECERLRREHELYVMKQIMKKMKIMN